MIVLAHNCVTHRVPFDSSRLFGDPYGDYHVALSLVVDTVAETNRREQARLDAQH